MTSVFWESMEFLLGLRQLVSCWWEGKMDLLLSQQHLGEFSGAFPTTNPTDRSLQNDVADVTTVTVPVGHIAISAEE